ncbi:MAG: hypothetical protein JRH15_14100 [Deltaproteobacteria bacterium]|nr:hypothetical protein [Deltaproteobacteria bacterium]
MPDVMDHIHRPLDEEVRFISGYYLLSEEIRLPHGEEVVLALLGHAVLDTACCGTTGCGYALVPGFVQKWKYKENSEGLAVSQVLPIRDDDLKKEIDKKIRKDNLLHQVIFL